MTATVPISRSPARNTAAAPRSSVARPALGQYANAATERGSPLIVMAFLSSLLIPFIIPVGSIALQPHRIVILLTMPILFIRLITGRAGRVLAIDFLLLFGGLWSALGYTFNYHYTRNAQGIGATIEFGFSYFFEFYGGYLIARVGIRNKENFQRVTKFMFYCVIVAIPLAAIEAITHKAFLMELLGRRPAWDTRFGMRRAQVVFGHPILYGAFVSSALGLVWYTYRLNAPIGGRVFRSALVFIALFFSFSMGAIMSFLVQIGSIVYERLFRNVEKRWTLLVLAFIGLYILMDIFSNSSPFSILVRYATFNQQASYVRLLTFEYGLDNIRDKPFFGFGPGQWIRPPGFPRSVDNFWLLTAMQFGLPAFFALAISTALIMRKIARKSLSDPMEIACRAAVLTSMGGIVLAGGTVHYWQNMLAFIMFIFGSGLWLLSRPDAPPPAEETLQDTDQTAVKKGTLKQGTGKQDAGKQAPAKKRFVPYGREA